MTTAAHEIIADESAQVALRDVESELSRRMKLIQGATQAPVLRARMSNLVIFCGSAELASSIAEQVPVRRCGPPGAGAAGSQRLEFHQ